jgi:3-oxoadipate enol-lactonase
MWNSQVSSLRDSYRTIAYDLRGHGESGAGNEAFSINLFASEFFKTRVKEIADIREMIIKTSEQSLCNTLLALSERKETCTRLPAIKVPVLIMVGSEDKITPPDAARYMHERINGSKLQIIDHAGHISNLENPDEFNIRLKKFVASVYQWT